MIIEESQEDERHGKCQRDLRHRDQNRVEAIQYRGQLHEKSIRKCIMYWLTGSL